MMTLLHKIDGREEGHEITGWSYNGQQLSFGYLTYNEDGTTNFIQGIIDRGKNYIMNATGSTIASYTFRSDN